MVLLEKLDKIIPGVNNDETLLYGPEIKFFSNEIDTNNKFKLNDYEQLRKRDLENVIKDIYCVQPKIFQNLNNTQSKTIVGFLNLLLDTEQRDNILDILFSPLDFKQPQEIV